MFFLYYLNLGKQWENYDYQLQNTNLNFYMAHYNYVLLVDIWDLCECLYVLSPSKKYYTENGNQDIYIGWFQYAN